MPFRSRKPVRHRTQLVRRTADALAAAAIIAGGTQAYAAPIRYDNPPGVGHFDWAGAFGSRQTLDITLPYYVQYGTGAPDGGFVQGSGILFADPGNYAIPYSYLFGSLSGKIETTLTRAALYYYDFVDDVPAGTLIPSGLNMRTSGQIYYEFYYYGYPPVATVSDIGTNGPKYIGVQFESDGHTFYGWIGVQRTGFALDAFAWGYETTPGVHVAAGAHTPPLLGDMNDDGVVNSADVPAFVDALLGLPLPPGSVDRSDMNGSGATDGADIQPFINVVVP